MEFWIIWFIGFIVSYVLLRAFARKEHRNDYNWEIVISIFLLSLFSWFAIMASVLLVIVIGIIQVLEVLKNHEPPKWL